MFSVSVGVIDSPLPVSYDAKHPSRVDHAKDRYVPVHCIGVTRHLVCMYVDIDLVISINIQVRYPGTIPQPSGLTNTTNLQSR